MNGFGSGFTCTRHICILNFELQQQQKVDGLRVTIRLSMLHVLQLALCCLFITREMMVIDLIIIYLPHRSTHIDRQFACK